MLLAKAKTTNCLIQHRVRCFLQHKLITCVTTISRMVIVFVFWKATTNNFNYDVTRNVFKKDKRRWIKKGKIAQG